MNLEKLTDPVEAAVMAAVASFSRPGRQAQDRRIWLWYCHRLGVNTLLDQLFRLEHELEADRAEGRTAVRNPAAVFHRRLQEIYRYYHQQTRKAKLCE
jgi:hypothetical protein